MAEANELHRPDFDWDIVRSADSLVILASILAAFVFAALVILLTAQPPKAQSDRDFVMQLLLGAFFSLVVSSFLFAVLAGGTSAAGRYRPFIEGYAASWILSLATVQLCVSAVWLLQAYAAEADVLTTGRIVAYAAVAIAAVSLTGVATAPAIQRTTSVSGELILWWFGAAAVALLSIPIGWLLHTQQLLTFYCVPHTCTAGPILAGVSLAAVLLMTLVTAVAESLTEQTAAAAYWGPVGKVGFAISMVVLGSLYTVYMANLPGL